MNTKSKKVPVPSQESEWSTIFTLLTLYNFHSTDSIQFSLYWLYTIFTLLTLYNFHSTDSIQFSLYWLYTIFQLDFGTLLTLWYFFCVFHFISCVIREITQIYFQVKFIIFVWSIISRLKLQLTNICINYSSYYIVF
jgi:hypothetical protein